MATSSMEIEYEMQPAALAEAVQSVIAGHMKIKHIDPSTGRITASYRKNMMTGAVPVVFIIGKAPSGSKLKIEVSFTAVSINKSQDQRLAESHMTGVVEILNASPALRTQSGSGW